MADPSENDDWAELARELEQDKPSLPTATPAEYAHAATPEAAEDEAGFADEVGEPDESESTEPEAGEAELGGEPTPAEGPPGTGRKRRRRRRRRRKGGGPPADGGAEPTAPGAEAADAEEGEAPAGEFEPEEAEADSDYPEEVEEDFEAGDRVSAADAEEDAGGELLRELIANWNVPSWDDVVAGLYRPER